MIKQLFDLSKEISKGINCGPNQPPQQKPGAVLQYKRRMALKVIHRIDHLGCCFGFKKRNHHFACNRTDGLLQNYGTQPQSCGGGGQDHHLSGPRTETINLVHLEGRASSQRGIFLSFSILQSLPCSLDLLETHGFLLSYFSPLE